MAFSLYVDSEEEPTFLNKFEASFLRGWEEENEKLMIWSMRILREDSMAALLDDMNYYRLFALHNDDGKRIGSMADLGPENARRVAMLVRAAHATQAHLFFACFRGTWTGPRECKVSIQRAKDVTSRYTPTGFEQLDDFAGPESEPGSAHVEQFVYDVRDMKGKPLVTSTTPHRLDSLSFHVDSPGCAFQGDFLSFRPDEEQSVQTRDGKFRTWVQQTWRKTVLLLVPSPHIWPMMHKIITADPVRMMLACYFLDEASAPIQPGGDGREARANATKVIETLYHLARYHPPIPAELKSRILQFTLENHELDLFKKAYRPLPYPKRDNPPTLDFFTWLRGYLLAKDVQLSTIDSELWIRPRPKFSTIIKDNLRSIVDLYAEFHQRFGAIYRLAGPYLPQSSPEAKTEAEAETETEIYEWANAIPNVRNALDDELQITGRFWVIGFLSRILDKALTPHG
ncbi:hypothetical protein B0T24DRAFT_683290 [Lasiosphaeria ovina]|uniref:Uncharacterized protein n=1 Tax=Lasiosphaeria ovina TaxID=92902 RepID=A0AAE0JYZ9_9PEZI|nr:hypothetical protein B0T24DRAFT_683290 [Lasiosphaeria ovina]